MKKFLALIRLIVLVLAGSTGGAAYASSTPIANAAISGNSTISGNVINSANNTFTATNTVSAVVADFVILGSSEANIVLQHTGAPTDKQAWNWNNMNGNMTLRLLNNALTGIVSTPITVNATTSAVKFTGNVSAPYLIGNGSLLTNLPSGGGNVTMITAQTSGFVPVIIGTNQLSSSTLQYSGNTMTGVSIMHLATQYVGNGLDGNVTLHADGSAEFGGGPANGYAGFMADGTLYGGGTNFKVDPDGTLHSNNGWGVDIYGNQSGAGSVSADAGLYTISNVQSSVIANATSLAGDSSGNIVSGVSDARLKTNVVTIKGGLAAISKLRAVDFNYLPASGFDPTPLHAHVIAQEVEAVIPEAVFTVTAPVRKSLGNTTLDDKNSINRPSDTKAVEDAALIAYLISAVQELNAKVDAQAAQITALSGNVTH
jgi:hypothetical protein